jgi:TetR/AcrR family transcriptional repressor of bet genes
MQPQGRTAATMAIDHDERRQEIAQAAIDVIANEGLAAATIRRIARQVGVSTTAVTRYFTDKYALLDWTYAVLEDEGRARFAEVLAAKPVDIVAGLLTMTACDPSRIRRWKAYLAFWDEAARDAGFAAKLRASKEDGLRSIAELLRAGCGTDVDVSRASGLLSAIVQGYSLHAIVDRQIWCERYARRMLVEALDMVLAMTKWRYLS